MFCTSCGKEINDGMNFCQYCGTPINNTTQGTAEPIKKGSGSFLRSLQEKTTSISESIKSTAEKAQKEAEERKIQEEQSKKQSVTNNEQTERFKSTLFNTGGLLKPIGYIIVDTLTGVNYMFIREMDGGGLTVLVDENGKPLVTKEDRKENDSQT